MVVKAMGEVSVVVAKTMNSASRQRGFTLIEILVAMAILALIGVGALSLLNAATQTSDQIRDEGTRLNNVQRTFLFISNDMQQLTTRAVRDEYGDNLPSIKSDQQASAPYVRFTRLGRRNPAKLLRSNLEHLAYSVEDNQLIRTSYTYADGMSESLGQKRPILDDVTDMKVEFFDGEEWTDYWPLVQSPEEPGYMRLPVAVRLQLELVDYGILERLYAISDKIEAGSDREADEERN